MYSQLEKLALLQIETLNKLLQTKFYDKDVKKIVKEAIEDLEKIKVKVKLIENNILTLIQLDKLNPICRL